MSANKMRRSLPCKICGQLYTDNIDPRVNLDKGGYIVCARCTMAVADALVKKVDINPVALVDAIKDRKLAKFRKSLGLTQEDMASRMKIGRTQYFKIENGQYMPSLRVLNKLKVNMCIPNP